MEEDVTHMLENLKICNMDINAIIGFLPEFYFIQI